MKTVKEQQTLIEEAKKSNVLVTIDYHKRWDPIYVGTDSPSVFALLRGVHQYSTSVDRYSSHWAQTRASRSRTLETLAISLAT